MPDPDVRANTPSTVHPDESPGGFADYLASQRPLAAVTTMPRDLAVSTGSSQSTQTLRLSLFTAPIALTVANVGIVAGGTAAGATPTLIRVGLYTVSSTLALTLVASTPNDTALLAVASTRYTKALSASYTFVVGQRYAAGILVVTGATAPTVSGNGALVAGSIALAPQMGASIFAQADLPASVIAATVVSGASNNRPYVEFLP